MNRLYIKGSIKYQILIPKLLTTRPTYVKNCGNLWNWRACVIRYYSWKSSDKIGANQDSLYYHYVTIVRENATWRIVVFLDGGRKNSNEKRDQMSYIATVRFRGPRTSETCPVRIHLNIENYYAKRGRRAKVAPISDNDPVWKMALRMPKYWLVTILKL